MKNPFWNYQQNPSKPEWLPITVDAYNAVGIGFYVHEIYGTSHVSFRGRLDKTTWITVHGAGYWTVSKPEYGSTANCRSFQDCLEWLKKREQELGV